MSITAVVDPNTGEFCEDGMKLGRMVVTVDHNPDVATERYSGDPTKPFAVKTLAQRAASVALESVAVTDAPAVAVDRLLAAVAAGINTATGAKTDAVLASMQAAYGEVALPKSMGVVTG